MLDYSSGGDPSAAYNGTNYSGVLGLIASGHNFGASTATASSPPRPRCASAPDHARRRPGARRVGFGAGETAIYEGQTVDSTTVIVKYTYAGDANLDGVIDADDYGTIDLTTVAGTHGLLVQRRLQLRRGHRRGRLLGISTSTSSSQGVPL